MGLSALGSGQERELPEGFCLGLNSLDVVESTFP